MYDIPVQLYPDIVNNKMTKRQGRQNIPLPDATHWNGH